ncbi:MAG TPA: DUF503 domain-containing protein [Bacillota bacterium]|nr:DUF503 domain-containing protein [Bacillota bacterium]
MDFFLGYCAFELYLPASTSLKDKRAEIKSLLARVRQKFNVGVAEVSHHEKWQLSGLAVVAVANERKYVEEVLDNVISFVERQTTGEVISRSTEIL